jgi:hypothetical protein
MVNIHIEVLRQVSSTSLVGYSARSEYMEISSDSCRARLSRLAGMPIRDHYDRSVVDETEICALKHDKLRLTVFLDSWAHPAPMQNFAEVNRHTDCTIHVGLITQSTNASMLWRFVWTLYWQEGHTLYLWALSGLQNQIYTTCNLTFCSCIICWLTPRSYIVRSCTSSTLHRE